MKIHARLYWIISVSLLALASLALIRWGNLQLTKYLEGEAFRAELEKQTARGLHFKGGQYAPIQRRGWFTASSESFRGDDGRKAMRTLEAQGISATFNPLGILLRRWQLDRVEVEGGNVTIQTYEPTPEPSPAKPWYHLFLPQRVYLRQVASGPVDVTWRLRGQRAGFFGTRLLITPHGRDFNYQATGGRLKMPLMPELGLRDTHLVITKELLTLYNLDLLSREGEGQIHAEGQAGTRDNRSVNFKFTFERLPIAQWLPDSWRDHARGVVTGKIAWRGRDPKLEHSEGEASLRLDQGRLVKLPFLRKLAGITGEQALEKLTLSDCSAELSWAYPKVEIKQLAVEAKEKFRAEGAVTIEERNLQGTIQLGVAPGLLDWLPNPEEVFPRRHSGYLWTTVHLSGTLESPQQDLAPRIIAAIKDDPGAALRLLFRSLGEWLEGKFNRD